MQSDLTPRIERTVEDRILYKSISLNISYIHHREFMADIFVFVCFNSLIIGILDTSLAGNNILGVCICIHNKLLLASNMSTLKSLSPLSCDASGYVPFSSVRLYVILYYKRLSFMKHIGFL